MAATTSKATNATTNDNHTTSEPSGAAEDTTLNAATDGDGDGIVHGAAAQPEPPHTPLGAKGKGKGKLKAGKKKGKDNTTHSCANCGEPASQRCTGCGVVHYCRKNIVIKNGKKVNMCQQVSCATHVRTLISSTTVPTPGVL